MGRRKVGRRLHTLEQKLRIVAEASAHGASVAEVARRHGLNANLVFSWRRQQQLGVLEQHTRQVKLLPVQVSESASGARGAGGAQAGSAMTVASRLRPRQGHPRCDHRGGSGRAH